MRGLAFLAGPFSFDRVQMHFPLAFPLRINSFSAPQNQLRMAG